MKSQFFAPCYFPLIMTSALSNMKAMVNSHLDNVGGSAGAFGLAQFLTGSVVISVAIQAALGLMISVLKVSVFYIVIVSVLMPLFNIFITFTVIKEIAAVLGTDIDISALEKII